MDEEIGFMDARIVAVAVNDERVSLLIAVPGLDYFAASLLVAGIFDITRFSSNNSAAKKF